MAVKKTATKTASQLEAVMSQIRKEFGESSIMRMGDKAVANVPVISTGAMSLDMTLGVGGLPKGRVIEVYGQESSGKTTLCLTVIAQAQKAGGVCAIIDAEHALDSRWAQKLGVDLDRLLVSQPNSGEEGLTICEALAKTGEVSVIVVDSVAALTPQAEIDGQMGDSHMGLQARLMSQAMRKLTSVTAQTGTMVIFTNQVRDKIGVMFGNPETTTGGKALKFYASVRLQIQRIGMIKDAEQKVVGNRTRVKVVKNKVAPPFGECEFDIYFDCGISWAASVMEVAIEKNILEKAGTWFSYNGKTIAQGSLGTVKYLNEHPEVLEEIAEKIRALPQTAVGGEEPADEDAAE